MPKNQKVAILIDQLFQDSEVTDPKSKLEEAGFKVDVIGPNTIEEYIGKKGTKIKADKSIDSVNTKDYVGLVIPGGWAPDKMRLLVFPDQLVIQNFLIKQIVRCS